MDKIFGEYTFSDDKALISINRVCELLENSYWASNRKRETTIKAIENSICIGIYFKEEMVGFARIVTDYATMYWLCDVIIIIVASEEFRGKGYGKEIVETILAQAKETGIKKAYLAVVNNNTTAKNMYEKIGFKEKYKYWYRKKDL